MKRIVLTGVAVFEAWFIASVAIGIGFAKYAPNQLDDEITSYAIGIALFGLLTLVGWLAWSYSSSSQSS